MSAYLEAAAELARAYESGQNPQVINASLATWRVVAREMGMTPPPERQQLEGGSCFGAMVHVDDDLPDLTFRFDDATR